MQAIYEELIRYCEPYRVPEPWARIGLRVECCRTPRYGIRVVERLAWEFTQADLIASGIAELNADRFCISSTLADPGGVLVVACSPKPGPCGMRVSSALMGKEILDETEATQSRADHQEAA